MKRSFGKIKIIYLIYIAVLLLLLLAFLLYARKTLILYEASQPKYVMDSLIAIPSFSISMNTSSLIFNEFESEEDYWNELKQLLSQNDVQYHLIRENYTDGSLTYGLYAGETPIGTAVLIPTKTVTRMIAIPITDWVLSELNAYEAHGNYNVSVTVPSNYSVCLNGIVLTDSYITENFSYEELTYCSDYVTVPAQVTYQVTGLKYPAQITVSDASGQELSLSDSLIPAASSGQISSSADNMILYYLPATAEMEPELEALVLDAVETYSNFFSKDLPGCRESIDPIRHLFPEDSIYLTLANQYRREDMGVFASHTNTCFLNESITEYIPYSGTCFSCRVSFDKSMTLYGGREMIDTTDNIYYFVWLDGNWVIADIQ